MLLITLNWFRFLWFGSISDPDKCVDFLLIIPRIKSLVCHSHNCPLLKTLPGKLSRQAGGLFVGRQYSGPRNKHPLRDECSLAPLYRFPEWLRPCLPPSLPEPGHWDHPSLLENPNPISKLNINQVRRLLTDGKGQEWKRPWRYEQRSGSAQAQPDNYLTSQMMPFTEALANDRYKANHGTFLK